MNIIYGDFEFHERSIVELNHQIYKNSMGNDCPIYLTLDCDYPERMEVIEFKRDKEDKIRARCIGVGKLFHIGNKDKIEGVQP